MREGVSKKKVNIMDRVPFLSVVIIWIMVLNLNQEHRANASCISHGQKRIFRRCNDRKRGNANAEFLKDQLPSMDSPSNEHDNEDRNVDETWKFSTTEA